MTQRHFHAILEASSDGIVVLVDGRFQYVNGSFANALGYEPAELLDGRELVSLVVPTSRDAAVRSGRLTGGKFSRSSRPRRSDGPGRAGLEAAHCGAEPPLNATLPPLPPIDLISRPGRRRESTRGMRG